MNNNVVFIGRLVEEPILEKTESGTENCEEIIGGNLEKTKIVISSTRSYKNSDGIYENDIIDCTMFNSVAKVTYENCKKGDLIAFRGRLTSENDENGNRNTIVIAEKVSFLSRDNRNQKEQSNDER